MKIGFTLKPRNGNILDFENQVQDLENIGAGSAEIPLYELDVISGKKIIQDELNLLQNITGKSKLKFSIHGSMSVNLLDEEYKRIVHLHTNQLGRNIYHLLILYTSPIHHL